MTVDWTHVLFVFLHTSMILGLLLWFIRYHLVPAIRYDIQSRDNNLAALNDEVASHARQLAQAEESSVYQEREIARLTACMEQWVGVLAQRAALAVEDERASFIRYKERLEENERARVTEKTKRIICDQVLKQARKTLEHEYTHSDKQHEYMNALCHQINNGGMRD